MTTKVSPDEIAELESLMLDGVTADGSRGDARTQAALDDEVALREAARTVWRRHCDQHGCTKTKERECTHPNHRRDVHYFRDRLVMLGIPMRPNAEWDAWFRDLYTAS